SGARRRGSSVWGVMVGAGRAAAPPPGGRVAVPAVVGEGDRLTLGLGEPVQAAPHALGVEAGLHDVGDHVVRHGYLGGPLLAGRGRGRGAHPVHRAAVRDGHRPGSGAALGRVEAGRGPPYLQQDLLANLLGLGRVAHYPQDEAIHRAGQGVVDSLERGLVASRYPREQAVQVLVATLRTGHFRLGCTHAAWPHAFHSAPRRERMAPSCRRAYTDTLPAICKLALSNS